MSARIRIVYVETPLATLLQRNRARPDHTRVPDKVIFKLLDKWELPDSAEAHSVELHWLSECPESAGASRLPDC